MKEQVIESFLRRRHLLLERGLEKMHSRDRSTLSQEILEWARLFLHKGWRQALELQSR